MTTREMTMQPATSDLASGPEFVAYFGHHKSGSTWITDVLRAIATEIGVALAETPDPNIFRSVGLTAWAEQQGAGLVCFTNAVYADVPRELRRGFHVIRDPRDILVSAYYSHRYSHQLDPRFPQLRRIRSTLEARSKDDGLLIEISILRGVFDVIADWNYDDPRILELKFEDMVEDAETSFVNALTFLGLLDDGGDRPGIGRSRLSEIVTANSFEVKTGGRARGETDAMSHYRKGIAGDWRNELTQTHLRAFEETHPGLVERLGYDAV